jgi:hypothetical protein
MSKNGTVFTLKENDIASDLPDDEDGLVILPSKFQSRVNDRGFFFHWDLLNWQAGQNREEWKGGNTPIQNRRPSRPPLSMSPWTSTRYHKTGHEGKEFLECF